MGHDTSKSTLAESICSTGNLSSFGETFMHTTVNPNLCDSSEKNGGTCLFFSSIPSVLIESTNGGTYDYCVGVMGKIEDCFIHGRSDLKMKIAKDYATMIILELEFVLSSSNRGRLLGFIDLMIQKKLLKRIKNETKGSKSTIWNSTNNGGF
ncbi:hypothetical protein Tco_1481985 [Tanacetum coccineum]